MSAGVKQERPGQDLPRIELESEMSEKLCLACSLGVICCQQVIDDFVSFDMGGLCVWKVHCVTIRLFMRQRKL